MCWKGGYLSLTSSPEEDYLAEGIASFMACKKYDETITTVNTSKGYDAYREKIPQQQVVKNSKGTKRILVVVTCNLPDLVYIRRLENWMIK